MQQATSVIRGWRGHVATVCGAVVILAGTAGPVMAGDPADVIFDDGTVHSGVVFVPQVPPAWKAELLDLKHKARAGTITAFEATRMQAIVAEQGNAGLTTATSSTGQASMAAVAGAITLPSTWVTQTESWWCGPAAAQSLIQSWHNLMFYPTTSTYTGDVGLSLSQDHLSRANYTGALSDPDHHSATNWVEHDMSRAINRWLFNGAVKYVEKTPTSRANLEDLVTTDLDILWMVASDMYEHAGGNHYNHHPANKDISHWTTIYAYATDGATIKFQDPAALSPELGKDWDFVNKTFSLTSASTYSYMTNQGATRGVVW